MFCSHACKGQAISAANKGKVLSSETRALISAARLGKPVLSRRKPPVFATCLECGSVTEYRGQRRYYAAIRRFCSTDCWYAYWRKHPEAHSSFKGGRYPYYGPDWAHQARLSRERDAHTCQDCGLRQFNPRLDVHHLKSRHSFNGDHLAANALDNLVTLCKSCHIF